MVIVSITDIHGRQEIGRNTAQALAAADLVVVTGDITQFGGEADARVIIENLQEINSNLICVPGNCDQLSVNEYLSSVGLNMHRACKVIDGVAFYGLGGSSTTPFGTPQEYGEEMLRKILAGFKKDPSIRYHVLVSHVPPSGTKVDQVFLGMHAGSKAVREFVEDFKPDLCLCGHIHEAIGSDRQYSGFESRPFPQALLPDRYRGPNFLYALLTEQNRPAIVCKLLNNTPPYFTPDLTGKGLAMPRW
jgi:hypothetical protein